MKLTLKTLITGLLLTSLPLSAVDIEINGNYLGGFNVLKQRNRTDEQTQFDYTANVDVNFRINDQLEGLVQLQMSPGNGALGFPGDGVVVTDLNVVYSDDQYPVTITMGSFDTPFGQQVGRLSNNADTFNNALIMNPLMYSAFAGPMGTLNTLGIMSTYLSKHGNLTVAVTNGTDESAANPEGTLEIVGSVESNPLFNNKLVLGASYMKSDDKNFSKKQSSGFSVDFSAWIVDAHLEITDRLSYNAYVAGLTYGDNDASTDDNVLSWMLEETYRIGDFQLSARVSGWHPQDNNGNRITGLTNPGLANRTVVTDQDVIRYEMGVDYFVNDNVVLRSEVFWDDYAKKTYGANTDVPGLLAFMNVRF